MKSYKITLLLLVFSMIALSAEAQKNKKKRPSPPAQITKTINGAEVTIDYSQPSKRGREIFGGLEEYGKVWRTGANETSWIEITKDVTIEGETLPTGKYGLFTIPGESEWTIIFNKKWDGWGAYEYDESEDVLRVKVASSTTEEVVEKFTIVISDEGDVSMAWDQTKVTFAIR